MNKDEAYKMIEMAKSIVITRKVENSPQLKLDSCINLLEEALNEFHKSDWVSVKDKLPDDDEDVLVCNQNYPYNVWISSRNSDYADMWKDKYGFLIEEYVTHWMPIPYFE